MTKVLLGIGDSSSTQGTTNPASTHGSSNPAQQRKETAVRVLEALSSISIDTLRSTVSGLSTSSSNAILEAAKQCSPELANALRPGSSNKTGKKSESSKYPKEAERKAGSLNRTNTLAKSRSSSSSNSSTGNPSSTISTDEFDFGITVVPSVSHTQYEDDDQTRVGTDTSDPPSSSSPSSLSSSSKPNLIPLPYVTIPHDPEAATSYDDDALDTVSDPPSSSPPTFYASLPPYTWPNFLPPSASLKSSDALSLIKQFSSSTTTSSHTHLLRTLRTLPFWVLRAQTQTHDDNKVTDVNWSPTEIRDVAKALLSSIFSFIQSPTAAKLLTDAKEHTSSSDGDTNDDADGHISNDTGPTLEDGNVSQYTLMSPHLDLSEYNTPTHQVTWLSPQPHTSPIPPRSSSFSSPSSILPSSPSSFTTNLSAADFLLAALLGPCANVDDSSPSSPDFLLNASMWTKVESCLIALAPYLTPSSVVSAFLSIAIADIAANPSAYTYSGIASPSAFKHPSSASPSGSYTGHSVRAALKLLTTNTNAMAATTSHLPPLSILEDSDKKEERVEGDDDNDDSSQMKKQTDPRRVYLAALTVVHRLMSSTVAIVRKEAIVALVSVDKCVGSRATEPYRKALNQMNQNLFERYREKMLTSSGMDRTGTIRTTVPITTAVTPKDESDGNTILNNAKTNAS